ncbi:helix-turn-helix domain-containing protein [Paenibacillus dendritiformis]|uniref:helix-turn-helix domain-containing protein n=1 Tax=Paenibacillus dendritiformis TaxID=130049 RepID=UPI001FD2B9EC|nr:helix-turn-helix transcriptional regulator [Paenibacillus dendritiformis]
MNDIGHKIRCIRKENNLNQVQFAKSIGISQGNLSEIELGNSNPSAETLISKVGYMNKILYKGYNMVTQQA